MAMGKSHDFSLVASRTWDIFSHDISDGRTKVMLGRRYQESYLVERDSSAFSSRHGSAIDTTNGGGGDPGSHSTCHREIGIPINFQDYSGIVSF